MRKAALLLLVADPRRRTRRSRRTGPPGPPTMPTRRTGCACRGARTPARRRDTAALGPDGYGAGSSPARPPIPPPTASIVYPTVSRDPGFNSDLSPGMEERARRAVQFARYASVCRPFAPLYRSGTVGAVRSVLDGLNPDPIFSPAYGDVEAAFHHYMRHYNNGRPVVIDRPQPGLGLRDRTAEARVRGPAARAPAGLGDHSRLEGRSAAGRGRRAAPSAACRSAPAPARPAASSPTSPSAQGHEPPADAVLGRASRPGLTIACTNPAALGSDARVPLDSYFFTGSNESMPSRVAWSRTGAPPAPFVPHPRPRHGRLRATGARTGYLSLGVNADPNDARADDIPGEIFFWRLHLRRLGHAPRRHECAAGRPHPHGRPAERRLAGAALTARRGDASARPARPDSRRRGPAGPSSGRSARRSGTSLRGGSRRLLRGAGRWNLSSTSPAASAAGHGHRRATISARARLTVAIASGSTTANGAAIDRAAASFTRSAACFSDRRDREQVRAVLGRDGEPGEAAGELAGDAARRRRRAPAAEAGPAPWVKAGRAIGSR